MQQGAVGYVRVTQHHGRPVVEKRFTDPSRQEVEVLALRALADQDLPVPELIEVGSESISMSLMQGERLDSGNADLRLERLRTSATLLRRLHARRPPSGLPPAPDDALIVNGSAPLAGLRSHWSSRPPVLWPSATVTGPTATSSPSGRISPP